MAVDEGGGGLVQDQLSLRMMFLSCRRCRTVGSGIGSGSSVPPVTGHATLLSRVRPGRIPGPDQLDRRAAM